MSQIFYSQVDASLRAELEARGRAGKSDRSTEAMNFMLGKIANVEIIAYKSDKRNADNELARLGGSTTRGRDYLPEGFLTPTTITVNNNQFDFNSPTLVQTVTGSRQDTSKRIPPVITSAEINIGDHSQGLLNKATINITVPNPDRDLDWVESVWFRPGRYARIKFAHPDSAVITGGKLINGNDNPGERFPTVPSLTEIQSRSPWYTEADYNSLIKLNEINFDGLITSFTFDYQPDGTVQCTLSLTGTSNVYTDISLLMDSSTAKDSKINVNITETATVTVNSDSKSGTNGDSVAQQAETPNKPANYIYAALEEQLDTIVLGLDENIKNEKTRSAEPILTALDGDDGTLQPDWWAIYGKPYASGSAMDAKYVTLGYLVKFIQDLIRSKVDPEDVDKLPSIQCTSDFLAPRPDILTTSVYYENMVSADPSRILLMADKSGTTNFYGDKATLQQFNDTSAAAAAVPPSIATSAPQPNLTSLKWYGGINNPAISFNQTIDGEQVALTARIFISLHVIRDITDALIQQSRSKFNIGEFLKAISAEISTQTGGAVNLTLITDPRYSASDLLIFYDSKKVVSVATATVQEFDVPMFANHPNGTIVHNFKFSAKLPESAKNLSYVLNQNPDKISELDIAPYMNFMYLTNEIERTVAADGSITVTINPNAQNHAENLLRRYEQAYTQYRDQLIAAKFEFAKNPQSSNRQNALRNALTKYIQYPTDQIQRSNQLVAPIFPFDAEVTIDGINGFRYGDVLQFSGLPERYRRNTVFSIINVVHTIGTDGNWTTKLRCIMRPRIK
jgi:hypothetical protein